MAAAHSVALVASLAYTATAFAVARVSGSHARLRRRMRRERRRAQEEEDEEEEEEEEEEREEQQEEEREGSQAANVCPVTVSAPGKVLIAGGYLVLERPNVGLVLAASARFYAAVGLEKEEDAAEAEAEKEGQRQRGGGSPRARSPSNGSTMDSEEDDEVEMEAEAAGIHRPMSSASFASSTHSSSTGSLAAQRRRVAMRVSKGDLEEGAVRLQVYSPQFHTIYRYTLECEPSVQLIADYGQDANPFVLRCLEVTFTFLRQAVGAASFDSRLHALRARDTTIAITLQADNDFYSQREHLVRAGMPIIADSLRKLPKFLPCPRDSLNRVMVNKTGMGSSAALTTALVGALLHFFKVVDLSGTPVRYHLQVVHNLAQLCHALAQGKVGSGFDVSAAVMGSQVYTRFSKSLIQEATIDSSVSTNASIRHGEVDRSPHLPPSSSKAFSNRRSVSTSVSRKARGGADDDEEGDTDGANNNGNATSNSRSRQSGAASAATADSNVVDSAASAAAASAAGPKTNPGNKVSGSHGEHKVLNPQRLREYVSFHEQWDHVVRPFSLPSGFELMMGDVCGGSETPSMVRKVLAWKAEGGEHAEALWTTLGETNCSILTATNRIHEVASNAPALYEEALAVLASQTADQWAAAATSNTVATEYTQLVEALCELRGHFVRVRALLKQIGNEAGVPIEPEQQTLLSDATMALPGVVAAGVPGAGGVDAIFAITTHSCVRRSVEDLWASWGSDHKDEDVCPLLLTAEGHGPGHGVIAEPAATCPPAPAAESR